LYGDACTPWEWHTLIMDRARELGLTVFSTPFDASAVDFLETLNVPCYKIASFENTDLPLIRRVASTGKPLVISTGMASVAELDDAVTTAREAGCTAVILLKCTSTYPASADNTNLRTIPHMRAMFDCEVGLSDHTMGVAASVTAVGLGATMIEKHFTLNRADGGVDSAFSMEPAEMAQLVVETRHAWQALGAVSYGPTPAERASLQFRRSLYVVRDVKEGELLTTDNVRAIRPGLGIAPKFLDDVLGRRASADICRGTPLAWNLIR
jgi:N-acetylneuraminate synthase